MNKLPTLAILLVAIGLSSLFIGLAYTSYTATQYPSWGWRTQSQRGMMNQWSQPQTGTSQVTIEDAKRIADEYLAFTQNPNLAIKEITEFQYNFYIIYYEKDTGIGAFEMLIWKQAPPSGMIGGMGMGAGMMTGTIMPEPGPNMMWNTKYNMGQGMMGQGMMGYRTQVSSTMTISKDRALELAQAYLDSYLNGAKVEDAMQFYGYYTIDFTINGKIAGMLSVNGQTGRVWYHSWHGSFIQEVEYD